MKLLECVERMGAPNALLVDLSFGGMTDAEVEHTVELFGREVLPHLHAHDVGGDIGVRHANTPTLVGAASSTSGEV